MSLNNTADLEIKLDHQFSQITFIGSGVALATIGLTGFTLNLLVIIFILQDMKNLWTPVNVVLLNLSISDLLMAALGVPFSTVSALSGGWPWSYELCTWYGWLMSTLGIASIGNLTAMAVDRCILITRPLKPFTTRHATFLAITVWIYALCTSSLPLFGFGKFGPEARNISCSIDWESHDPERYINIYIGFLFTSGFIIPVMIISFSYISILITLRRVKKRVSARRKQEGRITKMVALMIIAFLVGWLPYSVASLAKQFFHADVPPEISMVPAIIAKSSCAYNPIIYACLNPHFVKAVQTFFAKRNETPNRTERISKGAKEVTMAPVKLEARNSVIS